MSSEALYREIGERNRARLAANEPRLDGLVMDPLRDSRLGLSLIISARLDAGAYGRLVGALARIEPGHYYYPLRDLHTTVFDFVSAREDFVSDPTRESDFLEMAREACSAVGNFELRFRGVVFSAEAGLIGGYDDDALVDIRQRIREAMTRAGIMNDERYRSRSAHCTFMRFTEKFRSARRFLELAEAWEGSDFGAQTVHSACLVEHDWYNRKSSVRGIGTCEFFAGAAGIG
ncbi:MAG TPA: 2'-5' RNA ligase family protein [Rectinemataceae bacterium]|nr:2'-5' RNA ligase family protein [Rectinemataceae bacterium]